MLEPVNTFKAVNPPKPSKACCPYHKPNKAAMKKTPGQAYMVAEYDIETLGATEAAYRMRREYSRLWTHYTKCEGFKLQVSTNNWVPGKCVVIATYQG